MNTILSSLNALVEKLGGDTTDNKLIVDALNDISAKYGGDSDNKLIVDALNQIVDNYSGGGGVNYAVAEAYCASTQNQIIIEGLLGEPKAYFLMRTNTYTSTSTKAVIYLYKLFEYGEQGMCVQTSSNKGSFTGCYVSKEEYADGTLSITVDNGNFVSGSYYTFAYIY